MPDKDNEIWQALQEYCRQVRYGEIKLIICNAGIIPSHISLEVGKANLGELLNDIISILLGTLFLFFDKLRKVGLAFRIL